ncbi:MAG: SHOCT domain-containing protein [Ilumatobacteraceae bacterium]
MSNKSAANQQAKATQAAQAAAFEEQQQAAQIAAAVAAAVPAAPAAPAAGGMSDDDIAKLTQIANLHAQGILTDEEFAAQKAKILGL